MQINAESEESAGENTVLIGHSLGAVSILNLLNRRDLNIEAAYLVSAWTGLLPDEQFNEWNSTFQDQEFNFEEISDSVGEIHQFHSEDDPYVPIEMAKELSESIDSELYLKDDSGHFNTDSGYESFPELLDIILD